MSCQVIKRQGLTFSAYDEVNEANLEKLHNARCKIPTACYSEKCKTVQTVKNQSLPGVE